MNKETGRRKRWGKRRGGKGEGGGERRRKRGGLRFMVSFFEFYHLSLFCLQADFINFTCYLQMFFSIAFSYHFYTLISVMVYLLVIKEFIVNIHAIQ